MAELCRECFIAAFAPNAYDQHHIIMSKDDDFCECCLDYGSYVDSIDWSDLRPITNLEEFRAVVTREVNAGHQVACTECGSNFEQDDLAFVHETGECPYCHQAVNYIWVKG
jgi:hypothetical protein